MYSNVSGLGLGLVHCGLGLGIFLWPRPRPRPRAQLASLTSLYTNAISYYEMTFPCAKCVYRLSTNTLIVDVLIHVCCLLLFELYGQINNRLSVPNVYYICSLSSVDGFKNIALVSLLYVNISIRRVQVCFCRAELVRFVVVFLVTRLYTVSGETQHWFVSLCSKPGASIHIGQGGHVPPIFGLGDIITNVPLNISRVISATFYPCNSFLIS